LRSSGVSSSSQDATYFSSAPAVASASSKSEASWGIEESVSGAPEKDGIGFASA